MLVRGHQVLACGVETLVLTVKPEPVGSIIYTYSLLPSAVRNLRPLGRGGCQNISCRLPRSFLATHSWAC